MRTKAKSSRGMRAYRVAASLINIISVADDGSGTSTVNVTFSANVTLASIAGTAIMIAFEDAPGMGYFPPLSQVSDSVISFQNGIDPAISPGQSWLLATPSPTLNPQQNGFTS